MDLRSRVRAAGMPEASANVRNENRIPVGARFSTPVQIGPGTHSASCTMGTGSFPGVKSGRGVTLTPPHSSAVVMKG